MIGIEKNKYLDLCKYLSDLIKLRNKYECFTKDEVEMSFDEYYEVLIWHLDNLTIFINPCAFEHTYVSEDNLHIVFDENGFVSKEEKEIKIKPFTILITAK